MCFSEQAHPDHRMLSRPGQISEEEYLKGSVDAWKLPIGDPRKANLELRKELAHVSRLRDLYKRHGTKHSVWFDLQFDALIVVVSNLHLTRSTKFRQRSEHMGV